MAHIGEKKAFGVDRLFCLFLGFFQFFGHIALIQKFIVRRLNGCLHFNRHLSFFALMYHSTPIHTSATWLFSQNHIQNILCKVDNYAAEKGHKALRTLPGIVAFEGKTDLHNAEA